MSSAMSLSVRAASTGVQPDAARPLAQTGQHAGERHGVLVADSKPPAAMPPHELGYLFILGAGLEPVDVGPAGEVDVGVAEPGGDVWGATSRLRRRPGTVFYLDRRVSAT